MELVAVVFGVMAAACAALAWHTSREARRRSDARVAVLAETIDPLRGDEPAQLDAPMPKPFNPLAKIGIGFGAVTVAIVAAALVIDAAERRPATPGHAQSSALELISMQPQRQNGTLTVSGLVRNGGERPAVDIAAEITVVGTSGQVLATRRAPIQLHSLPPEADSGFSVTVDGIGAAQRYRIAFRGPEGIVRHVDRRAGSQRQQSGS